MQDLQTLNPQGWHPCPVKHSHYSLMMMKKTQETKDNGVKGAYSPSEGSSPGRYPMAKQHGPGRQSATAESTKPKGRRKWTLEENKEVMFCYYKSKPKDKSGYLKRFYNIWQERNTNPAITGQNLADRVRYLTKSTKPMFSKMQLQEIEDLANNQEQTANCEIQNLNKNDESQNLSKEITTEQPTHQELYDGIYGTEVEADCNLEILEQLKNNYKNVESFRKICPIPNLKNQKRKAVMKATNEVNMAIKYITTENITETNNLIYAAMITVSQMMGMVIKETPIKKTKTEKATTPPWKRRMNDTLQKKRKDLSRLIEVKEGKLKNAKIKEDLLQRYFRGNSNSITEQIEILKQEVLALKNKIERYSNRCKFYKDNIQFETNQRGFYQDLDKENQIRSHKTPKKQETTEFWSKIWQSKETHNKNAKWISTIKKENEKVKPQKDIVISTKYIKKAAKKMKNWKSAGPDQIQGFWLKNLTNLHPRLAQQLQNVLEGNIPQWLAEGRTTLILKNPKEPEKVSNYRPITCLTTTWKLLTSILADQIYEHLEKSGLIPWQQKGCKRKSRGTKDQLLIDKMITRHAKNSKHRRNLNMVWIDYKKAYDSVPHSWILKCLKIYGIASNIITFMERSMQLWITTLTILNETIGIVRIKRGIFQGDSLSPLLFIICLIPLTQILDKTKIGYKIENKLINHLLYMDDLKLYTGTQKQMDALVNTVRIFSEDIKMTFGLDKCAKTTVHRGKMVKGEEVGLPDGDTIKSLNLDEKYKYLGFMESDQISAKTIKDDAAKEYKRRIRSILKTKLHGKKTNNSN